MVINNAMKNVLAVIDAQTKFINSCKSENLIDRIVNKIKKRITDGYEIVFTFDDAGGDFPEDISKFSVGKKIYNKNTYGCKQLILDLNEAGTQNIEFIGVCTDVCVITNVLGTMAFLPFADISIDSSCCASSSDCHNAALNVMRACNIKVF